jgi:hypothetical protein
MAAAAAAAAAAASPSAPSPLPPRTGVILLCVRPSEALRSLAAPLCPYHDVYLCADREPGGVAASKAPQGCQPGEICVSGAVAAAAGFRGSVSWLPERASSRCKALFWICHVYRGPITRWWLLEEDVLVPSEAALLAVDARLPGADLIVPHHHPRDCRRRPHWSGMHDWPHWRRADGLFPGGTRLFSSLVCGMRLSSALAEQVARHAARNRRLCFCEILFGTLAAAAGLRIHTPPELAATIRWRHAWEKQQRALHPALLYHPVKDLAAQARIRQQGAAREDWRRFVEQWVADDRPAAQAMRQRWAAELGRAGEEQPAAPALYS